MTDWHKRTGRKIYDWEEVGQHPYQTRPRYILHPYHGAKRSNLRLWCEGETPNKLRGQLVLYTYRSETKMEVLEEGQLSKTSTRTPRFI